MWIRYIVGIVGLLVVLAASFGPLEAGSILFSADTASTADLEVIKADDPDPVLVGATLTYTIVVTNYGPSTSTAELTDTLPASVTFVSATSMAGSCGESEGTVTCSLGVLDSGSSATTTIEVVPTATGTITNTASVTGDVSDPDSENNIAVQDTTVGGADLEVIKADDPDSVLVGETLTYTIVVTNHGPSTSTAELTDTLPASVTFVSATSTAGSCGESEGTVTCSLGVLDSGSSATTTIEVIPTATGTITNTASVTGDVSDPDSENNIAVQDTTVGGADLEVTKGDDPDPVLVGETLTYTIVVTNHGPSTSTAELTDTLPASVTFVSATSTAGSCGESEGTVTCSLEVLDSGSSATTTIEVIPTATGSITNTATVTGDVSDPDDENNIAVQDTTVGGADLEVTKADDPDPVPVGVTLTYTIVVTNHGPSTSTAELTDTLPASVTFVSATSTAGSCGESEGTVTCSLGVLDSGSSATTTIEVVPTATGSITNTATVTGDVSDPDSENNIAVQDTTVGGADLEVIKADDPDSVLVGETLTYTIVVTNHGPSTSTAELTDTLPASVTFVSATSTAGSCGESEGTVTCSLGVLDSGSSATTTIEVIPTATGTITNTASVTGDVSDPDSENNIAVQDTTVGGADLEVTKGDDPDPVLVGETLTYTIVVTNHGPSTSTAELTDTLPASVTFVSATSTAGSCGESEGTVTCSLGVLDSGSSATTTIEVVPTATGTITNTASVTGDVSDPDSENNIAVQDTTVGLSTASDSTRGPGFWKEQFRGRDKKHIDDETLLSFLEIIRRGSGIFDEAIALSGIADANRIFHNSGKNRGNDNRGNGNGTGSKDATLTGGKKKKNKHDSTGEDGSGKDSHGSHDASTASRSTGSHASHDASKASKHGGTDTSAKRPDNDNRRSAVLAQTLAAWLNFANGAIDRDEMVDTDRDGVVDTTFGDLIAEVEAILVDPDATKSDLNRAKHLAEAVNRHDQVDPATAANETRINHKDRFSREDVHALLHRLLLRFR